MPKTLKSKDNFGPTEFWRIEILEDTIARLNTPQQRENVHKQAKLNHEGWNKKAKNNSSTVPQVSVLQGDWGDITAQRSIETGEVYAVLNMANAYCPGGGYLEGMIAQEENMFRRTDCHFYIEDDQMDSNRELYTPEMTQLINAQAVDEENKAMVYLDVKKPRVCIKGKETKKNNKLLGYELLTSEKYFEFYELKSAADDLRGSGAFNQDSMRRKIAAQLDTLHKAKIRHVILSAFGCGAFGNPASEVAQLYKEELIKRPGYFDDVTFAVYFAGYGPSNFKPFHTVLNGLSLGSLQENKKNNEPQKLNSTASLEPIEQQVSSTSSQPENSSNEIVKALIRNINSPKWDDKGFVLPFFNFRKVPNGIVELREAIKKPGGNSMKLLLELKKIAQSRLDHYPLFTKRDEKVAAFYYEITQITDNSSIPEVKM